MNDAFVKLHNTSGYHQVPVFDEAGTQTGIEIERIHLFYHPQMEVFERFLDQIEFKSALREARKTPDGQARDDRRRAHEARVAQLAAAKAKEDNDEH